MKRACQSTITKHWKINNQITRHRFCSTWRYHIYCTKERPFPALLVKTNPVVHGTINEKAGTFFFIERTKKNSTPTIQPHFFFSIFSSNFTASKKKHSGNLRQTNEQNCIRQRTVELERNNGHDDVNSK